ncbi:MAG: Rieske 2Fe-2S domain-containing protein [Acidimicrobiales bacterium]
MTTSDHAPQPPADKGVEGRITLALLVGTASALGLTVVYSFGGQPQAEGILLGVSLLAIGYAFAAWAARLMPGGEFAQERVPLPSDQREQEAFTAAFDRGEQVVGRRGFVKALVVALGALGAAAVFPIRSLGPRPGRSLFRTSWRPGSRAVTGEGQPVQASSLEVGGVLTIFPEGHLGDPAAQTLLIRLGPGEGRLRPGRESWSPDGLVAYSKVCTHAGCPVGLYEASTHELLCPCHQSLFDVLDGARPLFGPATRSLPQLPLMVDGQGWVRSQSDYTEAVGPGFWNRP